jgi:hypothetical protein
LPVSGSSSADVAKEQRDQEADQDEQEETQHGYQPPRCRWAAVASGRVVLDRRIDLIDNLATSESFRMFDGPRAMPSPGAVHVRPASEYDGA